MRKILLSCFIIFAIIVFIGCGRAPVTVNHSTVEQSDGSKHVRSSNTISVNGILVEVEVARTMEEKMQGLSGREMLPEGKGMLFVYDQPVRPSFWMKEMRFSIDIIWIRNGKVVDVSADLPYPQLSQPLSELPTFSPSEFATHVLEVPAGWAEKNGVVIGSEVTILEFDQ